MKQFTINIPEELAVLFLATRGTFFHVMIR